MTTTFLTWATKDYWLTHKSTGYHQLVTRSAPSDRGTVMGAGFYLVGREDLPVQELCAQNGEPTWLQRGELGGKVAGGESRQACWSQTRRAL